MRHANYCCRPIRVSGWVKQADKATGEVRTVFSTEAEPDNCLLVGCGSRLKERCSACAFIYQGDSYQVVVTGLRGGKGMPATVAEHPKVFVTLTAPSFGPVHGRRVRGNKVVACHPRGKGSCEHGVALSCSVRHDQGDQVIGTPICPECIEVERQVIWNAVAPELWHRFWTYLPRELAGVLGITQKQLRCLVVPRMVKVVEYQRRGVVHFHAVIRLDGAAPPGHPDAVVAPPAWITAGQLDKAVRAARGSAFLSVPELGRLGGDPVLRLGDEIDVAQIHGTGEITEEKVAAYAAKYLSKGAEGIGLPAGRLDDDFDLETLKAPEHIKALVWACLKLGVRPGFERLKLRDRAHGLGFGGHFLSKSLRYSTTYKALRGARRRHARSEELGEDGVVVDAWGRPEDDGEVETTSSWQYLGWGYKTHGEAWLAASAAARAREQKEDAREALAAMRRAA